MSKGTIHELITAMLEEWDSEPRDPDWKEGPSDVDDFLLEWELRFINWLEDTHASNDH